MLVSSFLTKRLKLEIKFRGFMKYEGERAGFFKRRTNEFYRKGLQKVGLILHKQVLKK
jgi:hypothetical protein